MISIFFKQKVDHFLPYAFQTGVCVDARCQLHEGDINAAPSVHPVITKPLKHTRRKKDGRREKVGWEKGVDIR